MKRLFCAALGALLIAAVPGQVAVSDLGWLSGRWETAGDGRWTEEYWSSPRAGIMIGYSRSGRGGTIGEFEHLRLQAGEDGTPVYWASPGGSEAVGFRLVEAGPGRAAFENPSHDFPQRISYRRKGDTLTATISARNGGNATSWTYRRR